MSSYVLYQHAGSKNHGCEALVRTIVFVIRKLDQNAKITLISSKPKEDEDYCLNKELDIRIVGLNKYLKKGNIQWLKLQLAKMMHNNLAQMNAKYNLQWAEENATFIAIGGDNYCYNKGRLFYDIDNYLDGKKKILWGCSIEPRDMDDELITHLMSFRWIVARESITFNALKNKGLMNVLLAPDTAFMLPTGMTNDYSDYIGINLSPLIMNYALDSSIVYKNYELLCQHIINNTNDNIVFIPHVITDGNDDRTAINELIFRLKLPKSRYSIAEDSSCIMLKGCISKCKYFVGARTHATIAAYSSLVPTLVLGYSVKSIGIAKDIFSKSDDLVINVSDLTRQDELLNGYLNIVKNKDYIRTKEKEYFEKVAGKIFETYKTALGV